MNCFQILQMRSPTLKRHYYKLYRQYSANLLRQWSDSVTSLKTPRGKVRNLASPALIVSLQSSRSLSVLCIRLFSCSWIGSIMAWCTSAITCLILKALRYYLPTLTLHTCPHPSVGCSSRLMMTFLKLLCNAYLHNFHLYYGTSIF